MSGQCHPANKNHFFSVEIIQVHILSKQLKLMTLNWTFLGLSAPYEVGDGRESIRD